MEKRPANKGKVVLFVIAATLVNILFMVICFVIFMALYSVAFQNICLKERSFGSRDFILLALCCIDDDLP